MVSEKKSVLITGCTTGSIGHALALEFHSKGFRVIATSRNLATMPDLVEHKLIETVQLDVCSEDSIAKAKAVIEDLIDGRLDYLINNAGGSSNIVPAVELDLERAKREFDSNFWGAVRMVQAFTPLLIQSSGGHIVNISSSASTMPLPYISIYCSAQAALNHYGDVLRIELAPFKISVTTIIAGATTNSRNRVSEEIVLKLTPGSVYSSGLDAHRQAVEKYSGPSNRMETEEFARRLVKRVTRRKPKMRLYIGAQSSLAWFMEVFFPRRLMAFVQYRLWGLNKVAEYQAKKLT